MKAIWMLPLAALVVGCSTQDSEKFQSDATKLAQTTGQAAGNVTLGGKVESVLRTMKWIDNSDIHVDAKDGVVTISGSAVDGNQKHEILETANGVKGVDKVVDHMVISKQ